MAIFIVILSIPAALVLWALCKASPRDPQEDEEQANYLKEWRRKHNK